MLENLIKNSIEPRMNHYEIQAKQLSNSKYVIIIEIGQIWISPHRVTLKGHCKFYSRMSIGKFPMNTHDLKLAFTITENITEKIRNLFLMLCGMHVVLRNQINMIKMVNGSC